MKSLSRKEVVVIEDAEGCVRVDIPEAWAKNIRFAERTVILPDANLKFSFTDWTTMKEWLFYNLTQWVDVSTLEMTIDLNDNSVIVDDVDDTDIKEAETFEKAFTEAVDAFASLHKENYSWTMIKRADDVLFGYVVRSLEDALYYAKKAFPSGNREERFAYYAGTVGGSWWTVLAKTTDMLIDLLRYFFDHAYDIVKGEGEK